MNLEGLATTAGVASWAADAAPRNARRHDLPRQGQGRRAQAAGRGDRRRRGHLRQRSRARRRSATSKKPLGVKVLDRSEADPRHLRHAARRPHEARLPVELAQLEYSLPRLKRMWTHLSRLRGWASASRGPGEKQLEVDRRLVDKRIGDLQRRARQRSQRRKEREVAGRRDAHDRLAGRLHQRRQEHADERADRRRRARRGQAVRHARHAHAALATARLGTGAARATRSASSAICRTIWSPASRPRSKKPGRPTCCCTSSTRAIRPSSIRLARSTRCSKSSAFRKRTRCWCSTRSTTSIEDR